ncbi:MAG: hypothetical protein QN210_06740 [Armatimonadota bacterium]|nr:hypothetical protein [Armatimonadota bacterium]MDR7516862.1 hypothetical protein [Armatimonadota bacterium]MDR7561399.1 hypothetical protein [Armatimonadota bacterium]MDR7588436.1 hypothetical protein [Armatimonadota bacterium]MDR7612095.1 hypothetical protein [Armatimonadota bacterium]
MAPDTPSAHAGASATTGVGPDVPAELVALMERARRALAGRLPGRAEDPGEAAPGAARADRAGVLAVTLEVDEATRQPVIRVRDPRTGHPVRDVPPAALMRSPGRGHR